LPPPLDGSQKEKAQSVKITPLLFTKKGADYPADEKDGGSAIVNAVAHFSKRGGGALSFSRAV